MPSSDAPETPREPRTLGELNRVADIAEGLLRAYDAPDYGLISPEGAINCERCEDIIDRRRRSRSRSGVAHGIDTGTIPEGSVHRS